MQECSTNRLYTIYYICAVYLRVHTRYKHTSEPITRAARAPAVASCCNGTFSAFATQCNAMLRDAATCAMPGSAHLQLTDAIKPRSQKWQICYLFVSIFAFSKKETKRKSSRHARAYTFVVHAIQTRARAPEVTRKVLRFFMRVRAFCIVNVCYRKNALSASLDCIYQERNLNVCCNKNRIM